MSQPQVASRRVPATVWAASVLVALFGLVSTIGAFVFAFPQGGALGYGVGGFFVVAGLALVVLAWRLRRGERRVWVATLALLVAHELVHRAVNLATEGRIPPEDLPLIAVVALVLVLLLVPPTRRFYQRT